MPCFHPTPAWKSKIPNASGKHPLVFEEAKGLDNSRQDVACGGCIGCRIDITRDWAVRIIGESRLHPANCFVTETYDDFNLPERNQLCIDDVQKYLKRLRYHHAEGQKAFMKSLNVSRAEQRQFLKDNPLRFFGSGEYGETTARPHYHHIFFGTDFADDRKKHSKIKGNQYWKSDKLNEIWGKGDCLISNVTPQSAAYVAGYVFKKVNGQLSDEHYARLDGATGEYYLKNKEFSHMSRRPGIGQLHFEKYQEEITLSDSVILNARQIKVPRYFDKLLEKSDPELLEHLKFERSKKAKKFREDCTRERLLTREECAKAKRDLTKRGL